MSIPLVLMSGLAADETVFMPQKLAFPQLVVPKWQVPNRSETLSAYCERLVDGIRLPAPCVLGGASFGGVVALEMSQFLHPLAVLLIGSVREPQQLPLLARAFRPIRNMTSLIPVRLLQSLISPSASKSARRISPHLGSLARQFRQSDPKVFKWSLREMLAWDEKPMVDCPVYQIHGSRDRILPIGRMKPDRIIEGGGHVISLTHGRQVNEFIHSCLELIADELRSRPIYHDQK